MGGRIGARSVSLRERARFVLAATFVAAALATAMVVGAPAVTGATTATAFRDDVPIGPLSQTVTAPAIAMAPKPPRWKSFSSTKEIETGAGKTLMVPASSATADGEPGVVTMLHGMCSDVAWNCEAVQAAMPEGTLLTCPTGNRVCGDNPDWGGDGEEKAKHIETVVNEALSTLDIGAERGKDVLMGFSRGAFVARDVAYARPGRYKAIVFIGAALTPDPALLKANGIQRVVFAAGDLDHAAKTMRAASTKLAAAGIESRYVSLGRVYHTLPPDTAKRLRDAVAWASE